MRTVYYDYLDEIRKLKNKAIFYDAYYFIENNNNLKIDLEDNSIFLFYSDETDLQLMSNALKFNQYYLDNVDKIFLLKVNNDEQYKLTYMNMTFNVNKNLSVFFNTVPITFVSTSSNNLPYSNCIGFEKLK